MLRRIIRFLAVVALALSPVWGVQTVDAASSPAPARAPYYPSFDSTGCAAVTGGFGGVVISCGTGAYLTTQITSAYGGCSEIDVSVAAWGSGPFIAVATAPVGGLTSTVTLTEAGDYFMRLSWVPTTTIGPIQIQFSAPNTGNMSLQNITVNPCPVPPTSTPVPPTNTPNPSDTATSVPPTATAGPSHTPTAIPTYTPLPSGHSTFTRTPTATATGVPATATPSPTSAPSERDCGAPSYPLLNCDFLGGVIFGATATHWISPLGQIFNNLSYCGASNPYYSDNIYQVCYEGGLSTITQQNVTAGATGNIAIRYQFYFTDRPADPIVFYTKNNATGVTLRTNEIAKVGTCNPGSGSFCTETIGAVTAGDSTIVGLSNFDGGGSVLRIDEMWITGAPATATPAPATATSTGVPGTPTATTTPTLTPLPIPGAMSTAIPSSTPCPGGCAVAKLTAIPGMATITTVDTSPFSPLLHLSLARSGCAPFGFALIPVPHIIGTPALGSTVPLSYTWTVPLTANWDDDHPYSNTAIQPCAMVKEIPTFVWDLTYWLSVLMLAVGYTIWLIGLVGRLSGEETING